MPQEMRSLSVTTLGTDGILRDHIVTETSGPLRRREIITFIRSLG